MQPKEPAEQPTSAERDSCTVSGRDVCHVTEFSARASCYTHVPSGAGDFGEIHYRVARVCSQEHLNKFSAFVLFWVWQGFGAGTKLLEDQYALQLATYLQLPCYVVGMSNPKAVGERQFLWNIVTDRKERDGDAAIDCGHILGRPHDELLRLWDRLAQILAQTLPRCVGSVHMGESMGVLGLVNQALFQI